MQSRLSQLKEINVDFNEFKPKPDEDHLNVEVNETANPFIILKNHQEYETAFPSQKPVEEGDYNDSDNEEGKFEAKNEDSGELALSILNNEDLQDQKL